MVDFLEAKTARYLHHPDWKAHKTFVPMVDSEFARRLARHTPLISVDRSFYVLIASATEYGGSERMNGIAILDNDNHAVVLDRHLNDPLATHGPTAAQKEEFERIMEMDWFEFSRFCRSHPRLRPFMANDIMRLEMKPHPGDRIAQMELGIVPCRSGDARTPPRRHIPVDPLPGHGLRPASRDEVISYLANRPSYRPDGGPVYMVWPLVPRTMLHRQLSAPALLKLRDKIAAPYLDGRFAAPAHRGSKARLLADETQFTLVGDNSAGLALMRTHGMDMAWDYKAQMLRRLDRLDNDRLAALYTTVKVLDRELSLERQQQALAKVPGLAALSGPAGKAGKKVVKLDDARQAREKGGKSAGGAVPRKARRRQPELAEATDAGPDMDV